MKATIRFGREGRLGRITLARGTSGNRFTADMAAAFAAACERCEDDSVWAVLLQAEGKDFCLGIDGRDAWPPLRDFDFVAALARVTRPVVAAIRGRAEAEGFELALAADLRVVSPRAAFAMTQLSRGVIPAFGGTQRLPRIVGVERALRAILLGERISARRALDGGLVAGIAVDPVKAAEKLAAALLERGPVALRFAKEAVRRALDLPLDDGARFEHDLYALLQTTADRAEGIRAFLEKRKPMFRGK